MTKLTAAPAVAAITPYRPTRPTAPCDLDLAGSEGETDGALLDLAQGSDAQLIQRYPDARPLTQALADRFGIAADRVLVTAGADDALERACRAVLGPGRNAVITSPTFEMLPRYVALAGATATAVPWNDDSSLVAEVIAATTPRTTLVAIVSPNNPTGAVITIDDVRRLHDALPGVLILLDLVYVEFADVDITQAALALSRVVVVRTFSKAWGLPGLRVGLAAGPPDVIHWMRTAGSPYPVAGPSLEIARKALTLPTEALDRRVAATRAMRARLTRLLSSAGLKPDASQANFVSVATTRAEWLRDALAGFGIAVRLLEGTAVDRVRITCPTTDSDFDRLEQAIRTALAPEAILFDLDGVLADVSKSYRVAIQETAARFGAKVTLADVRERKAAGNANNDWVVTSELIERAGITARLGDVTETFERVYQGDDAAPGLRDAETLMTTREWLEGIAGRFPLGIVTGRPRADADRFLQQQGIADLFGAVIVYEDGPLKPDPFPVRAAMNALGVSRAWMIGDTPDDIRAARSAGALPIGVIAPEDTAASMTESLFAAGAARVLPSTENLTRCLP